MSDELLREEAELKQRVEQAIGQRDWGEARRLADVLVGVYTRLEASALFDTGMRDKWRGFHAQWADYAGRLGNAAAKQDAAAPVQAGTKASAGGAVIPPAAAAGAAGGDAGQAARVLGLGRVPPPVAANGSALAPGRSPRVGKAQPTPRPPGGRMDEQGQDAGEKAPEWLVRERPEVSFDDIIGLDDLKQRIRRFIIKFQHPEEVAKWKGAKLGDRMILYGPPGTGKTMFAKAVAHEIAADFFLVKGSNILDKWVGESQKNVARMFAAVRGSERAVVFLDEIEGILGKRGSSSTVRDSVVTEFLQEMEGFSSPNQRVLFIGATNMPAELDDAIISRFGAMFFVPLPDRAMRLGLLERGFSGFAYGIDADVDMGELADRMEGHSMRAVKQLVDELIDIGILESAGGKSHKISKADIAAALNNLPAPLSPRELTKYAKLGSKPG